MTAHELARKLLEGPDLPVMVQIDPTDGTWFPMNSILTAEESPGDHVLCLESSPCEQEDPVPDALARFDVRLSSYAPGTEVELIKTMRRLGGTVFSTALVDCTAMLQSLPGHRLYVVKNVTLAAAETVAHFIRETGAICHIESAGRTP